MNSRIKACKMIHHGKESDNVYISEISECTLEDIMSLRENLTYDEAYSEYENSIKNNSFSRELFDKLNGFPRYLLEILQNNDDVNNKEMELLNCENNTEYLDESKDDMSDMNDLKKQKEENEAQSFCISKKFTKTKLKETHEQRCYYLEKEIAEIIDELAKKYTGFNKSRFVNEAVKLLIKKEYPEYVEWLRKDN